jgi:hypothetical protein
MYELSDRWRIGRINLETIMPMFTFADKRPLSYRLWLREQDRKLRAEFRRWVWLTTFQAKVGVR